MSNMNIKKIIKEANSQVELELKKGIPKNIKAVDLCCSDFPILFKKLCYNCDKYFVRQFCKRILVGPWYNGNGRWVWFCKDCIKKYGSVLDIIFKTRNDLRIHAIFIKKHGYN